MSYSSSDESIFTDDAVGATLMMAAIVFSLVVVGVWLLT
jgi:hypothetical protein